MLVNMALTKNISGNNIDGSRPLMQKPIIGHDPEPPIIATCFPETDQNTVFLVMPL
jgi:hypothetical protein